MTLVEDLWRSLESDFGAVTRFGDVLLDDMARSELYAVIKFLAQHSDVLQYNVAVAPAKDPD